MFSTLSSITGNPARVSDPVDGVRVPPLTRQDISPARFNELYRRAPVPVTEKQLRELRISWVIKQTGALRYQVEAAIDQHHPYCWRPGRDSQAQKRHSSPSWNKPDTDAPILPVAVNTHLRSTEIKHDQEITTSLVDLFGEKFGIQDFNTQDLKPYLHANDVVVTPIRGGSETLQLAGLQPKSESNPQPEKSSPQPCSWWRRPWCKAPIRPKVHSPDSECIVCGRTV